MDLDSKISFFAGYVFTAVSSISILGIVQAALIGFVGGFFGLLGKELYYSLKHKIKNEKDK
jgi:ABC-type microcin C transport system permease subunit YejE